MTLVRTALRLAAVNALQGADATSGPTFAQNRVYDSLLGDLDPENFPDHAKPTLIILTDSDEGEQLSRQNGGPPFDRHIDLVFELGMIAKIRDDGGAVLGLGYPETDAQLEAALDAFEFQIARRLGYDPDPSCDLFRRFFRPVKYECHRQVIDDAGVRIACRLATWTVKANDDQVKVYSTAEAMPTGLAALPDPLKTIAAALPAGSSGAKIAASLAAALAPPTAPEFQGLDATIANTAGQDASDMFDVSIEVRSAIDTPQVVATTADAVVDYAKGTFQQLILAANVTSLRVVNWPASGKAGRLILQVTNTGSFGVTGWQNTEWAGGIAPAITQGAGKKDIVVLTTMTAGAEVFGNIVGQDYR